MGDTDQLSRLLAVAALMVALSSFVVSLLTYRRAGAKVEVSVNVYSGEWRLVGWPMCIMVEIRNEGLAPVQITSVIAGFAGIPHPSYNHHQLRGFEVPGKLDGHHSITMRYPLAAALEYVTPEKLSQSPLHARVHLGSGRACLSKKRYIWQGDIKKAVNEYEAVRMALDVETAERKKRADEDFMQALKELGFVDRPEK